MRRTRVAVVLGVVLMAVTVGCAGPVPSPAPSASVASSPPSIEPSEPLPTTTATVVVDPTLLEVLPMTVGSVERREDPESAAEIAATIGVDVEALGVALYADVDDYAVTTVVRPRPGVVSEAWFRDWRDDFDAGVCEQAGGVDPGRSEFEVDGRTVHRSTCAGGVVIHHVRLADPDRIVSIQGAGPSDLGRAIVDDLTE